MYLKNYLFAILLLSALQTFGQKLSSAEKKIVKVVEQNHDESIAFLEKTININSGTFNPDGVREVGAIYQEMLSEIGFETSWIEMPAEMKRAGHLFGEVKGGKGKKILLLGHMDTVFEPESPFQKYNAEDSIATGPGVVDMKGGVMVMLFALKALKEADLLDDSQIVVMVHGDEENSGDPVSISRKDIIDAAKRSDVALCFEPGTGLEYGTVARRGISHWNLKVTGNQAHSSRIFTEKVGAGAVYETARILNRFYDELQEEYLTYNPGLIMGGSQLQTDSAGINGNVSGKMNVVANTTVVNGDLRFLSEDQKTRAREKMSAIVADNLPGTTAEIEFHDGFPAMPPTDGNLSVLAELSQVNQDLGQGEVKPYDPGGRGAGDISFIAEYLDCLDGLGPVGGNSHAPEEYLNLNTIDPVIKRAAILIYRLANQKESDS